MQAIRLFNVASSAAMSIQGLKHPLNKLFLSCFPSQVPLRLPLSLMPTDPEVLSGHQLQIHVKDCCQGPPYHVSPGQLRCVC